MAECSTTFLNIPIEKWTAAAVSSWLKLIGVKEQYVTKLNEEEVGGKSLLELTEDYLKKDIGMKSGQALLIIKKRNELKSSIMNQNGLNTKSSETNNQPETKENIVKSQKASSCTETQAFPGLTTREDCKPRPFCKDGIDFTYVKHSVLQPESGVFDLICPCHEYKSFAVAATLDRRRLQAKLAKEILKFGTGCINIRSNGTIHFGVMDSKNGSGYVHGEIIGVPVLEKDIYVDALDYIERSFSCSADREDVRQCIRPPQFIEVINMNSSEKTYVVEVDIVPAISIVRNRVYSVCLPNFNEKSKKVEFKKQTMYCRVGAKTEPVSDENEFNRRIGDRDARRKEAECPGFESSPDISQALSQLVIGGKKSIEEGKWHILTKVMLVQQGKELISIRTRSRKGRRNVAKARLRTQKTKSFIRHRKRQAKAKCYIGPSSSTECPQTTVDSHANTTVCSSCIDTELLESENIFIYDGPIDASEFDECAEMVDKLYIKD